MTASPPRVAFFPDSYNEVNGVAHTARQFEQYARRHGVPMLLITGAAESRVTVDDSITRMELQRGRISFGVEKICASTSHSCAIIAASPPPCGNSSRTCSTSPDPMMSASPE